MRHPAVEALPAFGAIAGGRTNLVLRGDLDRARTRRLAAIARRLYQDVNARFIRGPHPSGERPVDVCVFDDTKSYRAFAREVFGIEPRFRYGMYVGEYRLLLVNLAQHDGNLRHELVHPLLKDDFPDIPWWLNEGIASLYGGARYQRGRYRFLVGPRLLSLRAALRWARVPTLEQLASSGYEDVYGPAWPVYYAVGRYLLLYLERDGTLDDFYRDMRARRPSPARQLSVLRRYVDYPAFLRWARGRALAYHESCGRGVGAGRYAGIRR